MKKYFLFFTMYCSLFAIAYSQNLVPNPSFESYSACPDNFAQINRATPWYDPTNVSSDYFNACDVTEKVGVLNNLAGVELAFNGSAYAGLVAFTNNNFASYREYIQVALNQELKQDKKYCVVFFVSLADSARYSTSNLSAYFSKTAINNGGTLGLLSYVPQIVNTNMLSNKNGWTEISGSFIAEGSEKYITIGNFDDDANTNTLFVGGGSPLSWNNAYYYIDDVAVYEEVSADTGQDTTICIGDSIILGTATDTSITYSWLPNNSLINTTVAQPIATPTATTTYYLTINTGNPCKGNLTDSVTVTVINCDTLTANPIYIPNVFSPNVDGVNDEFNIHGSNIKTVNCKIYNRWGQEIIKVERSPLNHSEVTLWDGRTLSGVECPTGVYVYYLNGTYTDGEPIEKWGNVTLIR